MEKYYKKFIEEGRLMILAAKKNNETPCSVALKFATLGASITHIKGADPATNKCLCENNDCLLAGIHVSSEDGCGLSFSTDLAKIGSLVAHNNFAILTGQISGIAVIEVAPCSPEKDMDALFAWALENKIIMDSPIKSFNINGGFQLFFKQPKVIIPKKINILPGVSVFGNNEVVVCPGSTNGNETYHCGEFPKDIKLLPELPQEFVDLIYGLDTSTIDPYFYKFNLFPRGHYP